jgi:nitrous oxide reductase accessory protein NosL
LQIIFLLSLLLASLLNADSFTKAATIKPTYLQNDVQKEWCPVCAMSIETYYKTSHAAKIDKKNYHQYCSMRCLALEMQSKKVSDIKVVDSASQKLIDANKAFYVVDSDVMGTMSKVSKLAFATKENAEEFNMEHGGKIVDFTSALKMAQESLITDMGMVQNKKNKQVYGVGEKIFSKKCKQDISLSSYGQINMLKADIITKKLCLDMPESELQPLTVYLWEVKRVKAHSADFITVTKDEKCPVCGMFVYKYPKWAAQITYKNSHLSFDGVKDMMKYYFANKRDDIKSIRVSDYYSQKSIDATSAYFVIGSDVLGPMGHEFIPFASFDEAKIFKKDHKAKQIVKFSEITKATIEKMGE